MLDAFIIEKIKREDERRRRDRAPLTIENPSPPRKHPEPYREESPGSQDRGVVIIDL